MKPRFPNLKISPLYLSTWSSSRFLGDKRGFIPQNLFVLRLEFIWRDNDSFASYNADRNINENWDVPATLSCQLRRFMAGMQNNEAFSKSDSPQPPVSTAEEISSTSNNFSVGTQISRITITASVIFRSLRRDYPRDSARSKQL